MIFLFDVDGTLTYPETKISYKTYFFLKQLPPYIELAVVSKSDISTLRHKLVDLSIYKWIFTDKDVYINGKKIQNQQDKPNCLDFLGKDIIHFFGDKNKEENLKIFNSSLVISHITNSPNETQYQMGKFIAL